MTLFSPLTLRGVTLPNRVMVSPMSQYIALNGYANDWHLVHLGRFALGGAGLVFTEATAVEARGRRTHGDLGLWEDGQTTGLARIAAFIKRQGAVAGLQLGHAGRKASERRPWHGETPVTDEDYALREEPPWQAIAPSPLPYGEGWPTPLEMDRGTIETVLNAFAAAARRAHEAGFDIIEVYAGHGFLVHQFASPLANARTDDYGGSLDNRMRFAIAVADAIRRHWPDDKALMFRLSATDWIDGGWTVADTVVLAKALKAAGVDAIDVSSGGIGGADKPKRMPLGQGFQVEFAARVRRDADIATATVGMIWDAGFADAVIRRGEADLVALAREILDDPNWPLHAAARLGADEGFKMWKPQFGWWLEKRDRVVRKLGLRDPLK